MSKKAAHVFNANGEKVGPLQLSELSAAKAFLMDELAVKLDKKELTIARNTMLTAFVLTRPAAETRKLLAEGGKDAVAVAADEMFDALPPSVFKELAEAIGRIAERSHLWADPVEGSEKNSTPTAS